MQKRFLLFLLALVPLAACGPDYSFDSLPDLSKSYLVDRNGDLLDYSGSSTYESVGDFRTADSLISSFENGESGLFLFAQYTCSPCKTFEPYLSSYAINSKADITTFYRDGTNDAEFSEALSKLSLYFGISSPSTPSLFVGKKGSYSTVSWGSNSENYLRNSINSLASFTNVYHFGTAVSYEKETKQDVLSFLFSSKNNAAVDFYASILYPLAKASKKRLYLIDYDRLSEADRTSIYGDFSLTDKTYSPAVSLNGTTISAAEDRAATLVKAYYA